MNAPSRKRIVVCERRPYWIVGLRFFASDLEVQPSAIADLPSLLASSSIPPPVTMEVERSSLTEIALEVHCLRQTHPDSAFIALGESIGETEERLLRAAGFQLIVRRFDDIPRALTMAERCLQRRSAPRIDVVKDWRMLLPWPEATNSFSDRE